MNLSSRDHRYEWPAERMKGRLFALAIPRLFPRRVASRPGLTSAEWRYHHHWYGLGLAGPRPSAPPLARLPNHHPHPNQVLRHRAPYFFEFSVKLVVAIVKVAWKNERSPRVEAGRGREEGCGRKRNRRAKEANNVRFLPAASYPPTSTAMSHFVD